MTTRPPLRRVVVVGASLAGLSAAERLRRLGFTGELVMVGEEPHQPYDRPPLSKQLLKGDWDSARVRLRRDDQLDGLGLDWRLGTPATGLDPAAREVRLADGTAVGYDAVLIATGTRARSLPNPAGLEGIHTLRTLDDALRLRAELERARRLVVVGGGFVGAEVAAEARRRGLAVTMIEALPVLMSRGLGPRLGQDCADLHTRNGVDVRCGVGVAGFEGAHRSDVDAWCGVRGHHRITAVRLTDGSAVPADLAIVGIGSAPIVEWLDGSGLAVEDGIVCDPFCRAGAPGVYAAGDVASWMNPLFGEVMRVEHWTNAREQGSAAAETLLADHGYDVALRPYAPVPYVWSDQYGARIQVAGRPGPLAETVEVVHRDRANGSTVEVYGRGDRLVAAVAINAPRLLLGYRQQIAARGSWSDALASA